MKKSMIITTTNSVEGKEIIEYLGIISDRIVVGAGLFSEFFASFTDLVGGRSGKFEARMNELYNHLMSSLEAQARKIKADAVIGLKVDMDEISGKNSQMFMISGVGTAVKLSCDDCENNEEELTNEEVIVTEDEIKQNVFKLEVEETLPIIENSFANSKIYSLTSELISKAYDLGYIDKDFVLKLLPHISDINQEGITEEVECLNKFITYLKSYYLEDCHFILTKYIKDGLLNGRREFHKSWKAFAQNISFPYSEIYKLINEINFVNWEDYVFPLLERRVTTYYKKDIDYILKILEQLDNLEPINVTIETQRNGLKSFQVWVCPYCGNKNAIDDKSCSKCKTDKKGFKPDFERNLQRIKARLDVIAKIAKSKMLK
ncbi:heavy metal-binding domain-containing protein [Sinanaerobacter chloroacetimidivorans]|uniref:UPF0145 protein KCX82_14150 n=1 Tax=Sinanaerobacter chloroacetimidivorans TaxID=2818044 RepID=A0A8J7W1D9_9FIRM|nr:heavy metal-binding domain-containing protein [Sinanaerobacter chloroacetimidivorans]MBR0599027.1 heavy metal-binding domain-containing protein [Sinanaerobacter chloroacetimidivorans]